MATLSGSRAGLAEAQSLQRQGRLAEAADVLRLLIAHEPGNASALHLLGVTLGRLGRPQEAASLIGAAIRVDPANPYMHANLGNALANIGRHAEAASAYERAAALKPDLLAAHRGRAIAELSQGRYALALASIERALALQPRDAVMLANRGNALRALDRPAEALASYDRSLALAPQHPDIQHNRALALLTLERHQEALDGLDRALGLAPDRFGIHFHRGVTLGLLERHTEALASFDRALALDGRAAEALNNRGAELAFLGRQEEALEAFSRAHAVRPDYVEPCINAGNVLKNLGRFPEALAQFDRALATQPDHAPAMWSKSLLQLSLGKYEEGWSLYESRLRLEQLREYRRRFSIPRWTGTEELAGKRIFVHSEQGLGDALQFCRFIPILEAMGADVVFEVSPTLYPLARSLRFGGTLMRQGEALPQDLDYYSPLLSLPLALRTRADSIPAAAPYLMADEAAVRAWRERLSALPGRKIGLNWQGYALAEKQAWIRGRSFALSCAAPLAQLPGITLISLQKGEAAKQRSEVEFGEKLTQLTDPLDTGAEALMETAALISALDLMITSDTSVAHLAGALGAPVWVALHNVPDWRWLLDRTDSPWYPSMRLFRQHSAGDWARLFERISLELALFAS